MTAVVDIVGHFGTTFSYATVGSHVARALLDAGLLGSVSNLDSSWHGSFEDLRARPPGNTRGSHVLLFTAPHHYIDVYADSRSYGRGRSAIFASPNTDTLAAEHAETLSKFGLVIVPSPWCAKVVYEGCRLVTGDVLGASVTEPDPMPEIVQLPLGVDPLLAQARQLRADRIRGIERDDPLVLLHWSTDQHWPGRKGTQELLYAFSSLHPQERAKLVLRLHVPPALQRDVVYASRAWEVDENVEVVCGERLGGDVESLAAQFNEADLVVAPSRCEGFGLMLLASLAAGVPLLCTAQTGQYEFLSQLDGWAALATVEWGDLHGELGQAPLVDERMLTNALRLATQPDVLGVLADQLAGQDVSEWLWPQVLERWVAAFTEWTEGSDG